MVGAAAVVGLDRAAEPGLPLDSGLRARPAVDGRCCEEGGGTFIIFDTAMKRDSDMDAAAINIGATVELFSLLFTDTYLIVR